MSTVLARPRRISRRVAGLLTSVALVLTLQASLAPQAAAAYSESKGPNDTNRVTLTFDDCPKSMAEFKNVVVAARDLDIGLALLPTGNCITAGRFDAAYARSYGHYVFNHSITHPDLTTLSLANMKKELGAPGIVTSYGRPPYGAINATVRSAYASVNMKPWLWNVDTNDWRGKTQAEVISYVVANAKPGNSVLMHMQWNGFSAYALSQMKSGLSAKGIGVCRNYPGITPVRPDTMACNGSPTTPPPTSPLPTTPPAGSAFGDETGDRRADILSVDGGGLLLMHPTTTSLTTGPSQSTGYGWGSTNWIGRVPDVTGDGRHELLARRTDGNLYLYPGRGGGAYGDAIQVGNGWGDYTKLVVMPDVNGDGRPELFAADPQERLHSYRITATGLSYQRQMGVGWGIIRLLTTIGNSSGSSLPDLVAVANNGDLLSYTMGPGGVISGVVKIGNGWSSFDTVFSPGDLNLDGTRDLVGRRSDGAVFAYRHVGVGKFGTVTQMGTGWGSMRMFA